MTTLDDLLRERDHALKEVDRLRQNQRTIERELFNLSQRIQSLSQQIARANGEKPSIGRGSPRSPDEAPPDEVIKW